MPSKRLTLLSSEIQVTQYLEYQDYLHDLFKLAKQRFDTYSYLSFAEDLGFSATNVLRLVIARKRRLAEKSALTIAKHLNLKNEERKYFLNLVRFANVPSQLTKAEIFLQIYKGKKASVAASSDKDLMEYYASWSNPVILELISLANGSQEAEDLVSLLYPRLHPEQIGKTLELLERLQMIEKDGVTARWISTDTTAKVLPEDQAANIYSLAQFHRQMLEMASQCLMIVPRQEREYNALTIKLSTEQIPELKAKIRAFCASVMAMEEATEAADRILQVNIQMFPFTKEQGEIKA